MEHFGFSSFDEYAAAVQHADIRVTLTSPQETNWILHYLSLGDMSLQWGQDAGPNVVEGSSSVGGLTLFVPHDNADALVGNGTRMDDGSVMVLTPGSEFCMTASKVNRWSSIFVPYDLLDFALPVEVYKRAQGVLAPTESGKRLRVLVESFESVARKLPDYFWQTSAARIAKESILESVIAVLGFQNEIAPLPGRPIFSRTEIIQKALRIMDELGREHLSVQRLACLIGISERTLRTAFEEYFGITPIKYLKLRTLHQARRILQWSKPDSASVTEIVVGLGVWELGRFSHDYHMLFNELPSETLRRAGGL